MRIRIFSVVLFLLAVVAAARSVGSVANVADKKPNIVFIFADNFGYGELGSYGGGVTRDATSGTGGTGERGETDDSSRSEVRGFLNFEP